MKKLKWLLVLTISIVGMFQFPVVSQAAKTPTDAENATGSAISGANIELSNVGTTPSGTYGRSMRLKLRLINTGEVGAEEVSITPVVSASTASFPFEISKSSFAKDLDGDGPDESYLDRRMKDKDAVKVEFDFQVRSDVTTGYYPVLFEVRYKDEGED
ncbi:MAG: hypothetical protein GX913_04055, partial [Clostridiales bacterium]|nr:hypothetical protein [Clostridiales bacterium]